LKAASKVARETWRALASGQRRSMKVSKSCAAVASSTSASLPRAAVAAGAAFSGGVTPAGEFAVMDEVALGAAGTAGRDAFWAGAAGLADAVGFDRVAEAGVAVAGVVCSFA
jgi:hypothetical protein